MSEPSDDWPCKFGMRSEQRMDLDDLGESISGATEGVGEAENGFTFPCDAAVCEHDDEVTETKIRAFLDEKVSGH